MRILAVLVSCLVGAGFALTSTRVQEDAGVTPIQKVVEMLQGMVAKGREEKKGEEVSMAKFAQWCKDTDRQKTEAIAAADLTLEELEAEIAKAAVDQEEAGKKIAQLGQDMDGWAKDKEAATAVREKEHADFQVTHQDYQESLDALARAIRVLQQQKDVKQEKDTYLVQSALIQVKARAIPEEAKRVITEYLGPLGLMQEQGEQPSGLAVGAPEANAYETRSGGVVEMLETLRRKFRDEMRDLEKEEAEDRHAFDTMVQRLTDQTELAKQETDSTAQFKAKREQDQATAEGDHESTTKTRADDAKYLDDLKKMCQQKSEDYEARQNLRAEEIKVIEQAMEILTSDAVAGNSDKHIRPEGGSSFAQVRSTHLRASGPSKLKRISDFLKSRAKKSESHILAELAAQVGVGEQQDAFAKVKKMIQELVTRLMEEANNEAEHKGWCDTELATNQQTREQNSAAVETTTAKIEELQAEAQRLQQDLADLADGIAEIDKAVAEATAERQDEKAKNAQTLEDAEEGTTAVAQALAVLKEFYAKSAEATALLQEQKQGSTSASTQTPGDDAPETFDEPYQGQTGSGGVVAMLEVIASDFSRLSTETKAAEDEAEREYTQLMADSSQDKALKQAESDHKGTKLTDTNTALDMAQKELVTMQEELDASLAYYEKLKPSCINAGVSFEERNAQRKEEIESMQEALAILGDDEQDLSASKYASMAR